MIRKIALNWNSSYTELAAEQLCRYCSHAGIADFSDTLILVPTAEAGRLLREEMAVRYQNAGGVTGLNIELPDSVLFTGQETANEAQILKCWLEVFTRHPQEMMILLHQNPFEEDWPAEFYSGIAHEIQQLREELAADGLSLGDVLLKLEEMSGVMRYEEQERFRTLELLEREYLARLDGGGDPVTAKLNAMRNPARHRRVVIIGCSELRGAVINAVQLSSRDIDVMIFAPEEELQHFDQWGRPDIDYWQKWQIELDWQNRVRRLGTPAEQGRAVLRTIGPVSPQVIGVLDREVREFILDRAPEFYNPGSEELRMQPCTALFMTLMELAREKVNYDTAGRLARNFFIRNYLEQMDNTWVWQDSLAQLDKMQSEHIISSLDELHLADSGLFSQTVYGWRKSLQECGGRVINELWGIFSRIVTVSEEEIDPVELKLLRNCVESVLALKESERETQLVLLADILHRTRMPDEGNLDGKPEMAGFLELPWHKECALVLAGMNEDNFAYPPESGIFLPRQLREFLQMSSQELNYAADVVRFQSLLSRGGDMVIFFGRTSQQGDALSPSRLLLQCDGEEMYARAEAIFSGDLDLAAPFNARTEPPEKLVVPQREFAGRTMSVTGFAQYLKCPFRYYYERIYRAKEQEDRSLEMDPLEFGTVAHAVLEKFGRECRNGECGEITGFLLKTMESVFRKQIFGGDFGVVELQKEILRNNLTAFSGVQTALFEEGWRIKAVEESIAINWDELYNEYFSDHGEWRKNITIVGKLDRLDCRTADSGDHKIWRVVDYKTGNKGDSPATRHWGGAAALWTDDAEEERMRKVPGGKKYWTDLQLPLYSVIVRHILQQRGELGAEDEIESGYFNLPVAYAFTGVELFRELSEKEMLESAVACADYVLRRIFVDRVFWPPRAEKDMFDPLRARIGVYRAEDMIPPENRRRDA